MGFVLAQACNQDQHRDHDHASADAQGATHETCQQSSPGRHQISRSSLHHGQRKGCPPYNNNPHRPGDQIGSAASSPAEEGQLAHLGYPDAYLSLLLSHAVGRNLACTGRSNTSVTGDRKGLHT